MMDSYNSILHGQTKVGNVLEKNDVTMMSHTTKMNSPRYQVPALHVGDDEHRAVGNRKRKSSSPPPPPPPSSHKLDAVATASTSMLVDDIVHSNRKVSLDSLDLQQQQQRHWGCRGRQVPGATLARRPLSSSKLDNPLSSTKPDNPKETLQLLPLDRAYDESLDDGDDDALMTGCDFNSSLPTYMEEYDPRNKWTFTTATTEDRTVASPPSSPVHHQSLPVMPISSDVNDTNTLSIPPLWTTRICDRTDDGSKYVDGLDTLILPPLDDGREPVYVPQLQSNNGTEVYRSSPRSELFNHGPEHGNRGEEGRTEDFAFARRLERKAQPEIFNPRDLFR